MASNTNLFTDKDTNNWFKASVALIAAKQGLTFFLESELKNVYAFVGRSCGNCPIEKLIPCPTNPYCNKNKRNYCPFHKSQKPQSCTTCDNVKQNILLQHRYGRPSWRNTLAENWALNYWEIGKCYLPPDGYSSVSSVQESDFNGVISIMLNCLHFQTCLSCLCLSPPPPDKQCLLEKVRQIGRDVRHTSDCKVTDADLQDYFQTLSTLLTDPNYLQNDPSATRACTILRDLQNDRMSIEELGELLKEANQTLKNAQETGERFSQEAERTLSKALKDSILFAEQSLENKTEVGEQRLESKTNDGEEFLESKAHFGAKHIESKTQRGEERIEIKTQHGEQRIERKKHDAEQCLDSKVQGGTQRIEFIVHDGIVRMQQAANKPAQVDYERSVADFRDRLIKFYTTTKNNASVSPLREGLDKPIWDVFVQPKMSHVSMEKDGSRKKTENPVLKYKAFFTEIKS